MTKAGKPVRETDPEVWLAVETAGRIGSVAVWRDGLALEHSLRIQGTHSERVLPAIDYALRATQTEPEQVSAFVIGSGPGSFTGLRIVASLAKGWVTARGTPLYAYSSLLAVAAGSGAGGLVCPLFDARRGEVYGACYEVSGEGWVERLEPGAWPLEAFLSELAKRGLRQPVFAGEGAIKHCATILGQLDGARVLPEHLGVPRAASLLWLRQVSPDRGKVSRPAAWEPLYVRDWKAREQGSEPT